MSEQGSDPTPNSDPAAPSADPVQDPSPSLLSDPTVSAADPAAAPQLADGEWMVTPTLKGVGDKPEFMLEKFKSMDAQAQAYGELEKKFGAFTGSPDDYALNMPEGVEGEFDADDPLLKAGIEFAKESNMSQDAFDKMVGMWVSNTAQMDQSDSQAELEALGPNSAQRIQNVTQFLQNNLEAEVYEKMHPLINSADSIQIVEMLVNATAPRIPPINGGSNPDSVSKAGLQAMREQVYSDGPNKGELRFHHDPEFRKEIEAYSTQLHGPD